MQTCVCMWNACFFSRVLRTRLELRPDVTLEYQVSSVLPQHVSFSFQDAHFWYGSNHICSAVSIVWNWVLGYWHGYMSGVRCRLAYCPSYATATHFIGTTRVSRYQKGKSNLNFSEARDSEWQWHQLDRMQVCTSLQTDNHAITPTIYTHNNNNNNSNHLTASFPGQPG